MKDSGIEWIEEIPEHWEIVFTSSYFHEHKEKNASLQERNLLSLSYGNIKRKSIDTNEGLLPQSFETYNIINKGDIIFRLTDLQNDKRSLRTGLCKERGIITSAYVTLRSNTLIDTRFYHYLYHSYDICKVYYSMGEGVRQEMNFSDLRRLQILSPPLSEQKAIADFLDEKCAEIDKMIALQEEMIEELKKYKQSIITEAVTKGLNPDVPMKDSGIEWIGKIPEGWRVARLKNEGELHGRIGWNGLRSEEFEEYSYAYLVTGQDFCSSEIEWDKCYQIRKERYEEDEFIQLHNGEILITKDGTIGKIAIVSNMDKPSCLNSGIFVLRQKKSTFYPKFLYWMLYSPLLKTYNDYMNLGGTTIIHLYQNVFERMPIIIPHLEEQIQISDFLDEKCNEIDSMIALKQEKIEELKEYKKSLIYEYVTGKKEIPYGES